MQITYCQPDSATGTNPVLQVLRALGAEDEWQRVLTLIERAGFSDCQVDVIGDQQSALTLFCLYFRKASDPHGWARRVPILAHTIRCPKTRLQFERMARDTGAIPPSTHAQDLAQRIIDSANGQKPTLHDLILPNTVPLSPFSQGRAYLPALRQN